MNLFMKILFATIRTVAGPENDVTPQARTLVSDRVSRQSSESILLLANVSAIHHYYHGTISALSLPWSVGPTPTSLIVSTNAYQSHSWIAYQETSTQKMSFDTVADGYLGRLNMFVDAFLNDTNLDDSCSQFVIAVRPTSHAIFYL